MLSPHVSSSLSFCLPSVCSNEWLLRWGAAVRGSRGGFRITLLLMIIKRTICAKPLGCLLFSLHMERMFYLRLFWMSLHVWIEVDAIKNAQQILSCVFIFLCKHCVLTKRADKSYTVVHHLGYKAQHQAQHQAHPWKYIPYGNILSAQQMQRTIKMQTQLLTGLWRSLALLVWLQLFTDWRLKEFFWSNLN